MAEVRDLIRSLGSDGRTVLLSSHMLHEVEQVCDSLAILSRGKLIAQGNVQELLEGQGQVRIRTNNNQAAISVLNSLDWVDGVKSEVESLIVSALPERSWELTAALASHEIYVSEMNPIQMSLERYFLEVTGDNEPDHGERAE